MNRDPFYIQIVERLNGTLDPELFEQCANDLLRTIYPGLTPMRGGSDSGMDGAIADGRGEPFSLVTTTGKNVIDNLSRNLNQYIRDGGQRRQVVLATSRALTNQKKRNLYARARELGFTLLNIHDQAAFADLLYSSPRWCRELLNLSGAPPPFSKIPRTQRPFFSVAPIGRDASLTWLRQTKGDRLLLGQPGAGKTFLLYQLAQEDRGLFLVSTERGDIATGLRAQQPTTVFVDDAARNTDLLLTLRQIRTEMGLDFAIIAIGWPGDQATLSEALNLPAPQIHQLELLTRSEIVQVVNGAGVQGPTQLVREIVDQAEGHPGLAVTLALLCLQGGVREVVSGDTLSDAIVNFAERLISQQATYILATLAVAGDAGLPLTVVAQTLNLREIDIHHAISQLEAGGVVMEVGDHYLTVRPPVLRYALVRKVFFRGAPLAIEPVLAQVPSRAAAAVTLIHTRGRGANVPDQLLRSLILESRSAEVWEGYAWLGRAEAEWVLRQYPDLLATVATPGLMHAPEAFLPALLTGAVSDRRPLHAHPDHFLRRIDDWVGSAHPETGEALHRRRLLLEAIERWLPNNGDWLVGGQALQTALSPDFRFHTTDPGLGLQVTLHYGVLSLDELRQIQTFWPRVLRLLRITTVTDWPLVHALVANWAYPGRHNPNLSEEFYTLIRAFARQMLQDVVALAEQHPGTLHWAREVAHHLEANLTIPIAPEFDVLFPIRPRDEEWREAEERELVAMRNLAEQWSQSEPEDIARSLAQFETEANLADIRWPRYTQPLCAEIAIRVDERLPWGRALLAANLSGDLVLPFLNRAREADEEGWPTVALACLAQPHTRVAAIAIALTSAHPPEELLTQVMAQLDGWEGYVRMLCWRREIPEFQFGLLLRHDNPTIASAAAEGEWEAEPVGHIRETLRDDWERVVCQSPADHWLGEVLRQRPDLAYRWLQNQLADDRPEFFRITHQRSLGSAISGLTYEMRRDLLDQIPDHYGFDELVFGLVNSNLDLYQHLLSNERLRRYHLNPLARRPEDEWCEKAILAYNAGFTSMEIAPTIVYEHPGMISWSGNESAMWGEALERFQRLCSHPDERIRQIGEVGRTWAANRRAAAQQEERHEAVYGLRY